MDARPAHDPGGKVRTKLSDGMIGGARLSACGRYRFTLWRNWGPLEFEPYALWIGMNPSTADAEVNDPTITREINFTKALGLRCMVKCNVMDYRATDPKVLAGVQARSAENLQWILQEAVPARKVIAAWGALPKGLRWAARDVLRELTRQGVKLWCLGRTKDGSPRHPLYVAASTELEDFAP